MAGLGDKEQTVRLLYMCPFKIAGTVARINRNAARLQGTH